MIEQAYIKKQSYYIYIYIYIFSFVYIIIIELLIFHVSGTTYLWEFFQQLRAKLCHQILSISIYSSFHIQFMYNIYGCLCIIITTKYIYIYIYKEREREIERDTQYIYIYIYICLLPKTFTLTINKFPYVFGGKFSQNKVQRFHLTLFLCYLGDYKRTGVRRRRTQAVLL